MSHVVNVDLKDRSYPVVIGENLLDSIGDRLTALEDLGRRCVLVTDENVAALYEKRVAESLFEAGISVQPIVVPAGEPSKSMIVVEEVCRQMIRAGLDRSSFLIALGGGVVGDLAGFAAAVFYRGIPCIQLPTTVVAQVDSSVGGKTGVNTPEGKNLLGAFHQPRLVVVDTTTLKTLPDREYREGYAEIIKHAAIRDRDLVPLIENADPARSDLADLIERNVAIKAAVVAEDETETSGTRALLNFGHTIGHAIEASAGYGALLHGEAIALGLRAAASLSRGFSRLSADDEALLGRLLDQFELPAKLSPEIETATILERLKTDKKFRAGKIHFVLLREFGDAFVSNDVTLEAIEKAVETLR